MPASRDGSERRALLQEARLYLIGDAAGLERALDAALSAGARIVQLRDKDLGDEALLDAAGRTVEACRAAGALFVLNDRTDLAIEAGADGVHLGQDDAALTDARSIAGEDLLIGVSTHTPDQVDAAERSTADYLGVGPVHETPTKPGRPAVGLELVRHAAASTTKPFFAIGGVDAARAPAVIAAGARRLAVVRAICDAEDPAAAASALVATIGVRDGAVV